MSKVSCVYFLLSKVTWYFPSKITLIILLLMLLIPAGGSAQENKMYTLLVNFADAMLEYGRDDARYGEKTSPLFSTMLLRDTEHPEMLPYPGFYPLADKGEPGHRWNYYTGTNFVNIPFIGGEKVHKLTVAGEDVMENYGLYRMLYLMSEITGDEKYKDAATDALTWWYENTQGPSGLFPWGEHLGWDFRYDYVTYFVEDHEDFYNNPVWDYINTPIGEWINNFKPVTQLYQACMHEPRVPEFAAEFLLAPLASLPAKEGEVFTPLEKFAMGCFQEHVIDLHYGGYNRHGDYFGRRWGVEGPWSYDSGNFPRIMGQFYDYWSYTWQKTTNPAVKDSMERYMDVMIQSFIDGLDENGIMHSYYNQTYQATAGIELASQRLSEAKPALCQKLLDFANSQYKALFAIWPQGGDAQRMISGYRATNQTDLLPKIKSMVDPLLTENANAPSEASSYASRIMLLLNSYEIWNDDIYLIKAGEFANKAIDKLFDSFSPLPRINSMETLTSGDGTVFTNYYNAPGGCDELMWAIAWYYKLSGGELINKAPFAEAGYNQMVASNNPVTLDGSQSSDYEGDSLSFSWTGPENIALTNQNTAMPSFVAPLVTVTTTLTFYLVVNDGQNDSEKDSVYVIVLSPTGLSQSMANNCKIFPNPIKDEFSVRMGSIDIGIDCVKVADLSGKILKSFRDPGEETGFNVTDIPQGIYLVVIDTCYGSMYKKILKL